jgi:hypothetical protein
MTRPFRLLSLLLLLAPASGFAEESWKDHRSDECRCSAQFPGTPTAKNQTIPSKDGPLESKMIMLEVPSSAFYAVAYVDYPKDAVAASKPDELLNGARDGAVGKVKGSLKSETKISMNGFPGRELNIDAPKDLALIARIFLVKERLYQTIVVMPKARIDAAENRKFLDSFKFDKP